MVATIDSQIREYDMYIGGEWVASSSGQRFESLNPATGRAWASFPEASAEDVDRAVAAARRAFHDPAWADMTGTQRGRLLRRFADLVRERAEDLAHLDTIDSGRIISDTRPIAPAVATTLDYFAGWADKVDGRVVSVDNAGMFNYTLREPLGVIVGIVPWNNPLVMLGFKLGPTLAMGNTIVLKPSEHSSGSTMVLAELCEQAGFPPGVVNVVTGAAAPAQALCDHPDVDKISFTGSPVTARAVARAAAENLTPAMFELGGKSANVVFADSDRDSAINGALTIFAGTGQSCVAPSRLLLEDSIHDEFLEQLAARAAAVRMGDPLDPTTQMGPVATLPQLDRNVRFCQRGVEEGARVVLGGGRPEADGLGDGWFFEPTIFADADPQMYIAQEEAFGPILTVLRFHTEEEAVRIANSTRYGLAAGVWTTDVRRAHRMAKSLQAGVVWVNTWRSFSSATPFGGMKESGYGRENGPEALLEVTRPKSVWIEMTGNVADPFIWKG
ncbi:MAG: (Z)-2-((N-methylformamido)methylene)-5-hydroxybutyrolactone dehydrogenase [Solirubrobacteraceae bacterium]|jgi:aldehyde dehydrogenase (NAD+)|nr:(Z)-2-((N-methylformamido)methylene)-5-hydroxybutyrolactone dehydrogenase [Solirubrobacteraceae bacterium]